ncbi:MAG: site-2 protease family protein [Patescibacteria group bacterium]
MSIATLLFYFIIIVPSAIIHEYAHGWAAYMQGDQTAKYAGRLTLNPLVHIDRWGTILMPVVLYFISGGTFMFAYAKPVPFNPYNLRDQKLGPALVAVAGPLSNFLVAAVFALFVRILASGVISPAAGLDSFLGNLTGFLSLIVYANIMLAVFNLLPVPPLDGSHILYAILPAPLSDKLHDFFARYGFMILLVLIFFVFDLISPIINRLYQLFIGGVL